MSLRRLGMAHLPEGMLDGVRLADQSRVESAGDASRRFRCVSGVPSPTPRAREASPGC